jgi:hypothetical protein
MTGMDFTGLRSVSKKLNDASDALSKQIETFESVLNELKLGVYAWVVLGQYVTDEYSAIAPSTTEVVSLGYGKHKGKWCLIYSVEYPDLGDPEFNTYMPLREAPRHERIEAVAKLPALVRELESQASGVAKQASERANEVATLVRAAKQPSK